MEGLSYCTLHIDRCHAVADPALFNQGLYLGGYVVKTVLMVRADLYNVLHFVNLKNLR